jgi:serine/threonine protein kinase
MELDADRKPAYVVQATDWRPQGVQKCLAASPRNFVGLMEDGCSVLKYPTFKTEESMEALYEEAARYDHLGSHPNLVDFKGIHEHGLVFGYCEKGHLEDVILYQAPLTDHEKKVIGNQIVSCLIHFHEHNFIHCDLNVNNVFITSAMKAKVGDIQGQLYATDGSIAIPTMSQENAKSRHPHAGEDDFSVRTDIFALGTLLYYVWHGHAPFPELGEYRDEDEIQARYRRGNFPISVSNASGMDKIISKCWHSQYKLAGDVLKDMEELDLGHSEAERRSML